MERWKQYFQGLLQSSTTNKYKFQQGEKRNEQQSNKIPIEEVIKIIKELKHGKASGQDKITAEMIKKMDAKGKEKLLKLFTRIWKEENFLEEWQKTLIIPMYKQGSRKDCNNYRCVHLLCTAMKIIEDH